MTLKLSVLDVPEMERFIKASERLAKAVRVYNECHVDVGPACRGSWAKVIKAHDDLVRVALALRLNNLNLNCPACPHAAHPKPPEGENCGCYDPEGVCAFSRENPL